MYTKKGVKMDCRVINLIATMLLSMEMLFVKIGAQSGNDVNGVLTELYTTNGYNKLIRPLKNQTNVMDITVEFYLNCKHGQYRRLRIPLSIFSLKYKVQRL